VVCVPAVATEKDLKYLDFQAQNRSFTAKKWRFRIKEGFLPQNPTFKAKQLASPDGLKLGLV
jgi:hypothetical protein